MLHSDLLHGDEKSIWCCFSSSGGPPTLTIEGETPGAGGDERQDAERPDLRLRQARGGGRQEGREGGENDNSALSSK